MEIAKLILEYVRALVWADHCPAPIASFSTRNKASICETKKGRAASGVSVDLQEEVQEVKQLSEKIQSNPPSDKRRATPSIPLTEANARMIKLGLAPTLSGLDIAYYRTKAEMDPVLALSGLRIDLETILRNVAVGFKQSTSGTISHLLARLGEAGAVTADQNPAGQEDPQRVQSGHAWPVRIARGSRGGNQSG